MCRARDCRVHDPALLLKQWHYTGGIRWTQRVDLRVTRHIGDVAQSRRSCLVMPTIRLPYYAIVRLIVETVIPDAIRANCSGAYATAYNNRYTCSLQSSQALAVRCRYTFRSKEVSPWSSPRSHGRRAALVAFSTDKRNLHSQLDGRL